MHEKLKQKVAKGAVWISLGTLCNQGVHFVVSLVLARLLTPTEFGTVGLLSIFLTIAGSLATCGFGNALVQKKEAGELEFNTVFYLVVCASGVMYLLLFLLAPWVARFYGVPVLKPILRVTALQLILSSVNSIQGAEVSRKMLFHLSFRVSLITNLVSAIVGVTLAFLGFGVWALVWSSFCASVAKVIGMWTIIAWRPKWMFSWTAAKGLFSYGWKMTASGLIHRVYTNLYGFLIGKVYTPADLGYVGKGRSVPHLLMNVVEGPIMGVSFPALAQLQDDKAKMRDAMRRMIQFTSFVVFPSLMGLAVCARPVTLLLYGHQWSPSIPYVVIACFTWSLYPVNAINTMAISATGRSDVHLVLEVIKKGTGLAVMLLSIRHGVFAFMLSMAIVMSPFTVFVNTFANGRLLGYTPWMQFRDLAPSALLTAAMAGIVLGVRMALRPLLATLSSASVGYAVELLVAVPIGIAAYIALSLVFRPGPLQEACSLLLPVAQRRFPPLARSLQRVLNRNAKEP